MHDGPLVDAVVLQAMDLEGVDKRGALGGQALPRAPHRGLLPGSPPGGDLRVAGAEGIAAAGDGHAERVEDERLGGKHGGRRERLVTGAGNMLGETPDRVHAARF
jgi:hypothetical protein